MSRYGLLLLLMISVTKLLTCHGLPVQRYKRMTASLDTANYAIVFDAGSSKTKLLIYKIQMGAPLLDAKDIRLLSPSPKVKPGIAMLAENPSAVEKYLKPLLDSAMKTVPKEKHKSTPIFLFATAGMRLLSQDRSKAILDKVKKLFNDKNKCPFKFDSDNAKIISGAFEGIYAWISVNFLMGKFIPGKSNTTYGILEIGGASHQNAFDNPGNDTFSLTVGGKEYHLFARSYLGYGLSEARKRYLKNLSQESSTSNVIKSPCHHKDFEMKITIGGETFTVKGAASVVACRSTIKKLFFCKTTSCPFYDQPSLHGEFFGFSGIFYAAHGTGMIKCSDCVKPLSPAMFDESSRHFCAKQYQVVSHNPYAKNTCFESNFVFELLTEGYGLPADKMIQVGQKVGGFDLGWTLGAMLYNSQMKLL